MTGIKYKKKIKAVINIITIVILISGGYSGNMFRIFSEGNFQNHKINTENKLNSPIKDKRIIFLGSSVTLGSGSFGESFVEYLEKEDGIIPIKEAVSGTTLADINRNSYISRLKKLNTDIKADAFICQLSTNDATKNIPLGTITYDFIIDNFDTHSVAGAIEYIIAYANEHFSCPIIFYTQAKYESENYEKMVRLLFEIQKKWDITIIDLWTDENFNNISDEQKKLFLTDKIHPTKAGYKEWWLPEFRKCLYNLLTG